MNFKEYFKQRLNESLYRTGYESTLQGPEGPRVRHAKFIKQLIDQHNQDPTSFTAENAGQRLAVLGRIYGADLSFDPKTGLIHHRALVPDGYYGTRLALLPVDKDSIVNFNALTDHQRAQAEYGEESAFPPGHEFYGDLPGRIVGNRERQGRRAPTYQELDPETDLFKRMQDYRAGVHPDFQDGHPIKRDGDGVQRARATGNALIIGPR